MHHGYYRIETWVQRQFPDIHTTVIHNATWLKTRTKVKNDHVPVAFKHFIQILRVLLIPFLHPMASQRNNVSGMSELKIKYNMNLIVFVRVFGWIQSSITFFMMQFSENCKYYGSLGQQNMFNMFIAAK